MKRSKTALFILFCVSVACVREVKPTPVFHQIQLPQTRQEIINLESELTKAESIFSAKDPLFFETWKDKNGIQRYTIRKAYLDIHFKSVRLKNLYIKELENRIIENNKQGKNNK